MKRYTTESDAGRARAKAHMNPEPMESDDPSGAEPGVQKVDPSVRLGPLTGEIEGAVPMSITTGKPQAYEAKKGSP